ncbi:MAG: Na+/H+ antiporter subunit B [Bacteroidales bacterium]|nr:Na+/H+ antiporter subunit B [Bacteroidales bacterium]MCF8327452.1 Na+/H+ antiporter subunit B [Bacteroidales bacterium]
MISLILSTATRVLLPVLMLFSVFILLRGHHEPGGGFVGGLVAAAAFALYTISNGVSHARKIFPLKPNIFIIVGLSTSLLSGLLSLFTGKAPFTGLWAHFKIPIIGHLSTPFMFDIGVYLVVIGVATSIIFTLKLKE